MGGRQKGTIRRPVTIRNYEISKIIRYSSHEVAILQGVNKTAREIAREYNDEIPPESLPGESKNMLSPLIKREREM
jgi:hypothetical protein